MNNKLNDNFGLKDGGYSNYENSVNLPRHRWYYYKEGFSPLLVENAIQQVGVKHDEIILDPFNGSGTTTLTASTNNYKSIGLEVNLFTSFLSQAKSKNADIDIFQAERNRLSENVAKGGKSDLIGFSTFSKKESNKKWLFNNDVLQSFEGGWAATEQISSLNIRRLARLGLIVSAMENCNAKRDGKCLRYRDSWNKHPYNSHTFINSLNSIFDKIEEDLQAKPITVSPTIINGDCRSLLSSKHVEKFKLCITSPPYLNTFDYTDIYRPELFLGKFVKNNEELYDLRLKTVRSHIQAKWDKPVKSDFGLVYQNAIDHITGNPDMLMDKKIPIMVQAYFEDMFNILTLLKSKAQKDAQLWFVVSNSAYANMEIPVDLIIGDIGTKAGWHLKEIGVLRQIGRRKTKHSPDVNHLRESVIIFSAKR